VDLLNKRRKQNGDLTIAVKDSYKDLNAIEEETHQKMKRIKSALVNKQRKSKCMIAQRAAPELLSMQQPAF
jgi:hypothetical protein